MKKFCMIFSLLLCFQLISFAQLANGKWGIATEATDVNGSYFADADFAIDMWNYTNGNQSIGAAVDPFEGLGFYNFQVKQGQWWGFGFRSIKGIINMSNFWNGYIHIAVKTTTTVHFIIEVISDGSEKYGQIDFYQGNDPQNFKRDGNWHEIIFPLTKTGYNGLDISKITSFFVLKGDACATGPIAIGIDDMFWKSISSTDVKKVSENNSLTIFPNPVTNGQFYINTTFGGNLKVQITDLAGKEVFNQDIIATFMNKINIGNKLIKGVYLLSIKGKNVNRQEKLVIE